MKQIRALMGMTITVEIADASGIKTDIDKVFSYFENVENKFSVFKTTSGL